jgi:hypothetical protein
MTHADVLAFCRASPTTEEVIAMLSAITGRTHIDNPVCVILDKANDALMDIQESQRISELWSQDDADCKRGQAAGSVPAFLLEAV